MSVLLEEQPRGWCGWNRVSEGKNGRREDQRDNGRTDHALVGHGDNFSFYPELDRKLLESMSRGVA